MCSLCLLLLTSVLASSVFGGNKVLADENNNKNGTDVRVDPIHSNEGYSAVVYDNRNGLPTSEANAITQTSEGFIWIGSYSGLIRYDGNTFVNLSTDAGISSVVCLFVDSSDRLWIGTNDSGISVMEKGKFKRFGREEGLKSLSVRSICEDVTGNIIVGTAAGICYLDKELKLHTIEDENLSNRSVRVLKSSSANATVYGVTVDGCVFTLKNLKVTGFYDEKALSIEGARSLMPDEENPGYLYIGDSDTTIYYGSFISGEFSLSRRFLTGTMQSINSI